MVLLLGPGVGSGLAVVTVGIYTIIVNSLPIRFV